MSGAQSGSPAVVMVVEALWYMRRKSTFRNFGWVCRAMFYIGFVGGAGSIEGGVKCLMYRSKIQFNKF